MFFFIGFFILLLLFFLKPALPLVGAGRVSFLSPLITDYTCCCAAAAAAVADGRSQMSLGVLECLSSDCDDAVEKGCG